MTGSGGMDRDGNGMTGAGVPADTVHTLALDDEHDALPWLDSGDDDDRDAPGIDTGRLAGFAVAALVLLALLVGLVWWLSHRGDGADAVADGSTIEAPAEPYKTRPDDPGGKEFAGTGDTSFAVGEGQAREAALAADEAPAPAPETVVGTGKPAAGKLSITTADEPAASPEAAGIGVQVGAYANRASAEAGWRTLSTRHSALSGFRHRIVEGRADIGTVYRLQAVTADRASANSLCAQLKAQGAACQVKR